ncbi:TetR family transcriptional regulator [Paenibacillus algicola]|uniref:TetR family transcriptional regulator n=1 Tax=Paenibacillus algicola TaxID=2565926 RepID=A0A4P8XJZ1_9BACL|nr:TetR/AcrR family transcriptional regulator [Paenibacillus algicola]QCT01711.1 TetR family transcriptional regulator [Paenibacillus algicola]
MNQNLFQEILSSQQKAKLTVKQERVVEAAISLFAEKGYSNTSTAEIAKKAEVSEASIFKQYGTKERLLLSLVIPYAKDFLPAKADEIIQEIRSSNQHMTFEQFLTAFLKNRVAFAAENREVFQVLIKEFIYKEDLKNELLPYFASEVVPRLSKVIASYQARGELRDVETTVLVRMVFTFIGGFLASRFVVLQQSRIEDDEVEAAVQFIMNGISSQH